MAQDEYENKNAGELRDILKSITGELSRQRSIQAESAAEYRKMDSIARNLQDTSMGISNLTSNELDKLKQKNQSHIKELQYQAERLARQKVGANFDGQVNEGLVDRLKFLGKITTQEEAILRAASDKYKIEREITAEVEKQYKERLAYEEEVKNLQGATGAIVKDLHSTMDKLGLSSLNNYLQVDKAKAAMEAEADAIARGEKEGGKLQVRMAGLKTLAEGFTKSLFSAEAVIGFIVQQLAKGSQNMADFQKQTGMSYESAYKTNMEMKGIATASGDNFITSEKLNKSYAMMTEHLGVSADILGGTALVSATNLEQRLGMSADNAAQLTTYTRLQGKDTEKILSNSVATVGAFNKQNRTAINSRQVLNDVAGASKSMYLNMGKSTEALTKAATKARSLGLSLGQVEKISESLLNFEDSIGNELEANLLLGGGVNLAKAREYALTGDTAKLTEEIGKQESIRNAFATKNVIAQTAAAKALGISKEELAGMALQQDLNNLSAEEFKDRYGETTYESMKSRSASEKLGDALDKVKDILGSIIQVFSPFLDLLAGILSFPLAPYFVTAFIAAKLLGGGIGSIGKAFGGMYDLGKKALTGLGDLFKKGSLTEGVEALKDKVAGSTKAAIPSPIAPAAESVADGADKAGKSGNAEGFKEKMKNIAEGLKAFGNTKVLFGALNLIPSSIGLIAMIPGIGGAKLIEQINGEKFQESMYGLAYGIEAMGKGKVLLGSLGLIAASVGLVAMIPGVLGGLILAAAAKPISMGLEILATGLTAFGAAMMTGYGLVGLGALTLAAIGLGGALNLAAPGIEAFGTVLTSVFTGLIALIPVVVSGITTLVSSIVEGIGPMLLLGPALFGIAAGLGAVALAGLTSIPAIGGLIALSLAAPGLVALGMGGSKSAGEAKEKSEEGSLAAVEKKLDVLIAAVKAGGNVYMDSNKVGRAQVLGSYKSA